ncbi:Uncharacterised protein [Stutzerimonas stutzeri]|nr:Uncharacterised protein [Stutzerimonas stutzeri]CAB5531980.1 Uncharacterised protein [Stutzerimonas stutzeri]CAC9090845.1 Uncharacterised protein [Stutzerimonas stutzeri]
MDIYQVRPTTVGWELEDQQSHETVLRTRLHGRPHGVGGGHRSRR